MKSFTYLIDGIEYPVVIVHKRIKNIHYRFKDGSFYISCHPLTTKSYLIKGLDKFAIGLIEKSNKEAPSSNDYLYLLGYKIKISDSGTINFSNGSQINYKNREDLNKKLRSFFLELVTKRNDYYSSIMNVPTYKVSVRDMKTRFGSNSKRTKSIRYSLMLLHYSLDIIDSVIVHENAHILVFDHSKEFYNVVYKYCPNYKELRKKLIKGEYR